MQNWKSYKKKYVFLIAIFVFVLASIVIWCYIKYKDSDKMDIELQKVYSTFDAYQSAMEHCEYELADSYWVNPENNMYAAIVHLEDMENNMLYQVIEQVYIENLDFEVSDIEIDGGTAHGNIKVSICIDIERAVNNLPNILMDAGLSFEDCTEENLHDLLMEEIIRCGYIEKWDGVINFEKVNGQWKIACIREENSEINE